jgi:anti-sigma B factor antagonist
VVLAGESQKPTIRTLSKVVLAVTLHAGGESPLAVALHGEIDVATAGNIKEAANIALAGTWRTLVLDLGDVSFMDTEGLTALLQADRWLRAHERTLVLRRPSTAVIRILELAGLENWFLFEHS